MDSDIAPIRNYRITTVMLGVYDFPRVPQRGLGVESALMTRWDAAGGRCNRSRPWAASRCQANDAVAPCRGVRSA